jgi:UDP-glucose 4-epimerase
MSKPKIIVTGGCGYIGSHTVLELWDAGFDVISIDNLSRSNPIVLELLEKAGGRVLENHAVDITDAQALNAVVAQHSDCIGVIHFAAYKTVPESVAEPLLYYKNNINGLVNVLHAIQQYSIPNFVFSSSCSVYGNASNMQVTEDTPMGEAASPYAATKQMGEKIIKDFYHNLASSAMILRYFNPVGAHHSACIGEIPLQKPDNLFPLITGAATGKYDAFTIYGNQFDTPDGTCIRDYIHVSDIAAAHVKALQWMIRQPKKNIEVVNLGTGNGLSILQIIEAIEKEIQQKLNIKIGAPRPGDVVAIYANANKANSMLGWQAKNNLQQMCATALAWQQQWTKLQEEKK